MCNYATPKDIAIRLFRQQPIWYFGPPTVRIEGTEKDFGWLIFDFAYNKVEFRIYLKDKKAIMANAQMAVLNFDQIINQECRDSL